MIAKLWLSAKLWLAAVLPGSPSPPPAASVPATVDASAAWAPSADALSDLRRRCSGKPEAEAGACVLSFMERAGAAPAALDFARRLGGQGYLSAFDQRGRVGVARVFDPLSGTARVFLVNGRPSLVEPASPSLLDPLQTDPRLLAVRPDASLWMDTVEPPGLKSLPDGGQRFVFSLPVRTCDRCPELARGIVSCDFDADGRFLGEKLLSVRRPALFSVSGKILGGRLFEAPLGDGLLLRLEPFPEGWMIAVKDKAGNDYCALLTPPFQGPNDLEISGWNFQKAGGPGKTRRFRCLRTPDEIQEARRDVDTFLWKTGASAQDVAQARRDHQRLTDSARPGRLTVTGVRLGPSVGDKGPSIASLTFDFELSPAPGEK